MNEDELNEYSEKADSTPGVNTVNTIQTVNTISAPTINLGMTYQPSTPKVETANSTVLLSKTAEQDAKDKAALDVANGTVRVNDSDSGEDIVTTESLYKKNLGVTEYDELRNKLHLKEDESFTDYYQRTKYVPKGYEMQAKLLLAEEKRKKYYAEYEAGNISKEDFLYEAYGKDILKQEGIDFSSTLYWFNRYKSGDYTDPRDNAVFLQQLIDNANTLFQQEQWYKDKAVADLNMAKFVTGEELSADTIESLFQDQFDALSEVFDSNAKIVKYYRAGLLQGFNPTIDVDGDNKIDYYLSTDGKLYNVNETGEGANTMRAVYNSDGSLNRIVMSDSGFGEVTSEFLKGFGRLFTDAIDFVALLSGAVVDIFDGDGFGDTVAEVQASMSQFWNGTVLGDKDYVVDSGFKTSDGDINWGNISRQTGRLGGTIAGFFVGGWISKALGTGAKAATTAVNQTTKKGLMSGIKSLIKKKTGKEIAEEVVEEVAERSVKKWSVRGMAKGLVDKAVQLTSWSNGAASATTTWATAKSAAVLATKDTLQSIATLSINQKQLGLTDDQVVSNAMLGGVINFGASTLLRSTLDKGAIRRWGQTLNTLTKKGATTNATAKIINRTAPNFADKVSKGLISATSRRIAIGVGDTIMDSMENVITAWTQSSLATTGEVFNGEALKSLFDNPQFVLNSLWQAGNTLKDEFHYNKNNIIGATSDIGVYDRAVRREFSEMKKRVDPEDLPLIIEAEQHYNQTIKNRMNEDAVTYEDGTTRKYSQAEATLYAIEEFITKFDIPEDHKIILEARDHIKKNISQAKLLMIQSEFDMATEVYAKYKQIQTAGFKGKLSSILYGRDIQRFTENLGDAIKVYINYDINDRALADTKNKLKAYETMFGKTATMGKDHMDNVEVHTFTESVKVVVDPKTKKQILEVPDPTKTLLTAEELKVLQADHDLYGTTPNEANSIIIENKGRGTDQDTVYYENKAYLDTIVEAEKDFAVSGYPPSIIRLSENKYYIRYAGGEGQFQLEVNKIGSLVRALANVKLSVLSDTELTDISDAIALVFSHYDPSTIDQPIETLKANIEFIPSMLASLVKNKSLTVPEAAKVYTAIKNALGADAKGLPTHLDAKEYPEYKKILDMVSFMGELAEARELVKTLTAKSDKGLTDDDYKKASVKLESFINKYIKHSSDGQIKETNVIKEAKLNHLITQPELNQFAGLAFKLGQISGENLPAYFIDLLKKSASQKSNISADEQAKIDAFFTALAKKTGMVYDATSYTIKIGKRTIKVGELTDSSTFLKDLMFDRKRAVLIKDATGNNVLDGTKFSLFQDRRFRREVEKLFRNKTMTADTAQEFKNLVVSFLAEHEKLQFGSAKRQQRYDVVNAEKVKSTTINEFNTKWREYQKAAMKEVFALYMPESHIDTKISEFLQTLPHQGKRSDKYYLHTAMEWLEQKYNPSKDQPIYKNIKDLEELFIEGSERYNEISKGCEYLNRSNLLIINFEEVQGSIGEEIFKKLKNENIANIVKRKNDGDSIEKILFGNNLSKKSEYMAQQRFIEHQRSIREGSVLILNLDDAADINTAKRLLDKIYNFNGDIKYLEGKKSFPGIYTNSKQFLGMKVGDKEALFKLERLIEAKKTSRLKETKISNWDDPYAILERFSSMIPFITDKTTVNPKGIAWNFLDINDEVLTEIGLALARVSADAKKGKLASKKLKELKKRYEAVIAKTQADPIRKNQMFMYHMITELSEAYPDKAGGQSSIVPYTVNYDPDSTVFKNIDLSVLKLFYDVTQSKDGRSLTIKSKPSMTKTEFKNLAFKLISGKLGVKPNIEYLFPRFGQPLDNFIQHNDVARSGLKMTQTLIGDTAITFVDTRLATMFDQAYIEDMFNNNLYMDIDDRYNNISEEKYNEAITACSNKSVAEIIKADSTDNPFLQMQQSALIAGKKLSETFKKSLEDITYQHAANADGVVELTFDDITNSVKLLGNKDFRANLSIALREALSTAEWDDNNELIITDSFIQNVVQNFKDITTNPDKHAGDYDVYNSLDSEYAYLTGNQLEIFNPERSGNINEESIKKVLTLLDISKRDIIDTSYRDNDPLEKIYCAIKADSYDDNPQISIKHLYSISKEEFNSVKDDLLNIFDRKVVDSLEEKLNTIHGDTEESDDTTSITRILLGDAANPSYSSDGSIILKNGENIKDTYVYKKTLKAFERKSKEDNFIKIASLNTPEFKENQLLKGIYYAITNNKVLQFANSKASLMIQNFTIKENMALFRNSILNLAEALADSGALNIEINSPEDYELYMDIALDCYLATTGTEYQRNYPEFIIYDKSQRKIVDYALSGSMLDQYDNFLGRLLTNDSYIDPTTSELKLDNLVVLRVNRNAFNSKYSESLPSVAVLDLDNEFNRQSVINMIKHKSIDLKDRYNLKTDEEVRNQTIKYYYDAISRTDREHYETITKKSKGVVIDGVIDDVLNSVDEYSFTNKRRTLQQELEFNTLHFSDSVWERKGKQNGQGSKLNDAQTYGITYDVLMSNTEISEVLKECGKLTRNDILNSFFKEKKIPKKEKAFLRNNFDSIADAIIMGDNYKASTQFNNLFKHIEKNYPGVSKAEVANKVLYYYISETSDVASAVYRLIDLDGDPVIKTFRQTNPEEVWTFNNYPLERLVSDNKLFIDIEQMYNDDGEEFIYQISLRYRWTDEDGNTHYDVATQYFENDDPTLVTEDALKKKYGAFFKEYVENTDRAGSRESLNKYLQAVTNKETTKLNKNFVDLLQRADSDNALLVGFNSERFDIAKLVGANKPKLFDITKYNNLYNNHVDAMKYAMEVATKYNVKKYKGKLTLEGLAKQLGVELFDEKGNLRTSAHDADYDTELTEAIFIKLLEGTIQDDAFKNRFDKDLKEIFETLTGSDKGFDVDFSNNNKDIHALLSNLSAESKELLQKINDIRNQSGTKRVQDFEDILSEINYKRTVEKSNILSRELSKKVLETKSDSEIAFAKKYSSKAKRDFLLKALAYKIYSNPEIFKTKSGENFSLSSLKDETLSEILYNILKDITPEGRSQTKNTIAQALAESDETLLKMLGIDSTDTLSTWASTNQDKINHLVDYLDRQVDASLVQEVDTESKLVMFNHILSPVVDYIQKDLADVIGEENADNLLQEAYTFFDYNEERLNNGKPTTPTMDPINMLSPLDKLAIEYILTEPFTHMDYDAFYRKANTVPLNRKIVDINGNERYLTNNTIAMTEQELYILMGLDLNTTHSGSIDAIKQNLGLNASDPLYLPVVRHPLDKPDSFHFLDIIIMDSKHPQNKGLGVLVNVDTMRTVFNGDFDGDGITILRPDTITQQFASKVHAVKHKAFSMLDTLVSDIVSNKNVKYSNAQDIIDRQNLEYDKIIVRKIANDLERINSFESGNITAEYTRLKDSFIEYLINKKNLSEEDAKKVTDIIYIQEPLDISKSIEHDKRFIFYSDCLGLLQDPKLGKLNTDNRKIWYLANLLSSDLLNKVDTITGMLQKNKMVNPKSYEVLELVENVIQISKTTKELIANNMDIAKNSFKNIISNSDLPKGVKEKFLKQLSKDYVSENTIEQLLIYVQLSNQKALNKATAEGLRILKESDTPLSKMYTTYISEDKTDTVFSTYTKALRAKQQDTQHFFQHNSDKSFTEVFKAMAKYNEAMSNYKDAVSIDELADDYNENKAGYNIYKRMKVLYEVQNSDAYLEDVDRLLPGMNSYRAVNLKIEDNLPEKLVSRFKKGNIVLDPKKDADVYRSLGLDLNNPYQKITIVETKGPNALVYTVSVAMENIKLGTIGRGDTKKTTTVYANKTGIANVDALLNDHALLRSMKDLKESKILSNKFAIKKVYYDANGNELKPIRNNPNKIPEGTKYISAEEPVNLLEASRLWDAKVKKVNFEELAHGNNAQSSGGVWMFKGTLYELNEENGEVQNISFDNTELSNKYNEIKKASSPYLFDANGTKYYAALKLATAIKLAKELPNGETDPKAYMKKVLLNSKGLVSVIEAEVNRLLSGIDTNNLTGMDKAILSNELKDYVYGGGTTESSGAVVEASSKTSAAEQGKSSGRTEVHKSQLDILSEQDNEFNTLNNNYVPMIGLQNKLLKLAGHNSTMSLDVAESAELAGGLNHGIARKRTQTSGGPRDMSDVTLAKNRELNTTNTKIGEDFAGSVSSTEGAGHTIASATQISNTGDVDYYGREYSKRVLGVTEPAKALTFKKNYRDTHTNMNKLPIKRLQVLLKSIVGDSVTFDDILYNISSEGRQTYMSNEVDTFERLPTGEISYQATREDPEIVSTLDAKDKISDIGKSPVYFNKLEQAQENYSNRVSAILNDPSVENLDLKQLDEKNSAIEYFSKTAQDSMDKDADYQKWLELKRKASITKKDLAGKKLCTSLEDVKSHAETTYYSGSSNGAHKQFQTTPWSLNNNIVLNDSTDLAANQIVKNLGVEAAAKEQEYGQRLIDLQNIVISNGTEKDFNTFAYVIGLKNELDVIRSEQAKLQKDSNQYAAYEEMANDIIATIKNMGIEDAEDKLDTYIQNYEAMHQEEVVIFYDILKRMNFEAEKYSKLTGEPGQNIFFLLIPNTHGSMQAKKAGAKYMLSMLAKGSNPLNATKTKDGMSYTSKDIPTYAGYNVFSSLCDTISSVAKQSAIYENGIRLRNLGVMDSVTTQNALFEIFNSEEVQKALIENEKAIIKGAYKNTNQRYQALTVSLEIINGVIAEYAPEVYQSFQAIHNQVLRENGDINIAKVYSDIFNLLNEDLSKRHLNLEQAVEIKDTTQDTTDPNYIEATSIIKLNNLYSDVFAQLSGLTDDVLIDKIYNNLQKAAGDKLSIVDKFGRLQSEDTIYQLSENSLEYVIDNMDRQFGYKKFIVNKALRGELFYMDTNLAKVLADHCFVKQEATKFQKRLQQSSSWCVKFLMSNPLKLLDRVVKFSMFDFGALGTANPKTFMKAGKARSEMSAFFSSNGKVASPELQEFVYSQGLKLNSDGIGRLTGNTEAGSTGLLNTYTDAVGNIFNLQTMTTRYAYWLATKEDIERGNYSSLGSAYYLKNQMDGLDDIKVTETKYDEATDSYITEEVVKVSKAGNQAAFAMAQILGAPGDFPSMSKKLNKYGFVFTTFPLAALRWGIGELRSIASAMSDVFITGNNRLESATWLTKNGLGIAGVFMIENLLVSLICDMFGIDDEREEEWKEVGALPNITQTIFQGQPIMDTFSSMNPVRELADLTISPFIPEKDSEDSSVLSGFERFFNKNILSHTNPFAKNIYEVVTEQDLIDDQIISTKDKYGMFENVFRKLSGYVLGASGANAFTKKMFNGNEDSLSNFYQGVKSAISAEMGNTKVYKSNIRNYYKTMATINNFLYKDSGTPTYMNADFDSSNYDNVKSSIYKLINEEAKISDIYALLNTYVDQGYSLEEIRAAFRTCSIVNKLERLGDTSELYDYLTPGEVQNLKTALSFERAMFPWLEESETYLNEQITKGYSSNKSTYLNTYNYRPKTIYNKSYNKNYTPYNMSFDFNKNNYYKDPMSSYFSTLWRSMYGENDSYEEGKANG